MEFRGGLGFFAMGWGFSVVMFFLGAGEHNIDRLILECTIPASSIAESFVGAQKRTTGLDLSKMQEADVPNHHRKQYAKKT